MRWLVSGAFVVGIIALLLGAVVDAPLGSGAPSVQATVDEALASPGAPAGVAPDGSALDLYAFGDSLVAARQVGHGESFVELYDAADTQLVADRNRDGSGKGTLWALEHIDKVAAAHEGKTLLLLFGNNDPRPARGALEPEQTAANLVELGSRASAAGALPVVGNLVLVRPGCIAAPYDTSIEAQHRRIATIHASLEAHGIREVPFWDALDAVPFDGTMQGWNGDLYVDCIHPNAAGHANMAELLMRNLRP